jgi:hypothetical protein
MVHSSEMEKAKWISEQSEERGLKSRPFELPTHV